MNINKGYIAIGLIIAFGLFFELAAHADESDQATTITFSQPIQVPGQVLVRERTCSNSLIVVLNQMLFRSTIRIALFCTEPF
jgi:hypothetical protein